MPNTYGRITLRKCNKIIQQRSTLSTKNGNTEQIYERKLQYHDHKTNKSINEKLQVHNLASIVLERKVTLKECFVSFRFVQRFFFLSFFFLFCVFLSFFFLSFFLSLNVFQGQTISVSFRSDS
jgi:hypothetical protein